jgi:hypothetical protein
MNYSELKTAIRGDSHREDYANEVIERFITQGEALISMSLEGYFLEATIDEDDRVIDSIYTLPSKVTLMRSVLYNNCPLDQVDETLAAQYRNADPVAYCMRDTTILIAGIPPTDAEFQLNYFGMPAALEEDTDTNNLLNDCPQLYIEAAQVYLFKRARNGELATAMFQSVQSLIRDINRKMKKKLGGGQSANAYNVSFRSSY